MHFLHSYLTTKVIQSYQTFLLRQKLGGKVLDYSTSSLLFGSLLGDSNQLILLQLIKHVNTFAKEGLFRKSDNKGRMDLLVKRLEAGQFSTVTVSGDPTINTTWSSKSYLFFHLVFHFMWEWGTWCHEGIAWCHPGHATTHTKRVSRWRRKLKIVVMTPTVNTTWSSKSGLFST